jgi:hypothetical protein
MKTIAEQLNIKEFPFYIKNNSGMIIYIEYSNKVWKQIEYDSNGNETYFEDNYGYKIDKRVTELTLDQIAEKFGIEVSQ